ncbi:MAG: sugar ABC transporter permease [Propionibacteriaceae bacterium]|jgi:multiple sugar transport system permease protein|nr:sugar ABC transporter permease [Propionibacteriaceae bacterium]
MSTATLAKPTKRQAKPHRAAAAGTGARNQSSRLQLLFSLPALVWFLFFTIGPLGALFYFSTLKWAGLIAPRIPNGIKNFTDLLVSPVFHQAIINTIIQTVISLPIVIVGAFLIAYYLNLKPRGHRFIRALLFTPVLLSASALPMIFSGVFANQGMLNGFFKAIGLTDLSKTTWLVSDDTALGVIIAVTIWGSTSVSAIMFTSRLNTLDSDVMEAAELDGCGHWRRIWLIAWPICLDFIGVVTMLQFLYTVFSSGAVVLLLTKGGPINASTNLSFLVYDYAFNQSKVGLSQAVAVMLFVVGVIGLLAIRRVFRQRY